MIDIISRLYSFSTESFFSSPKLPECFWAPPSILFSGSWGSYPGIKLSDVWLTTHLTLLARLKVSGAMPLFSLCLNGIKGRLLFMSVSNLFPIPVAGRCKATCLLGLRVRVPPEALASVSCECCMLSGRDLCDGPIPPSEESHPVWCVWVRSDATVIQHT